MAGDLADAQQLITEVEEEEGKDVELFLAAHLMACDGS